MAIQVRNEVLALLPRAFKTGLIVAVGRYN